MIKHIIIKYIIINIIQNEIYIIIIIIFFLIIKNMNIIHKLKIRKF